MKQIISNIFEEENFILEEYKNKKIITRKVTENIEWGDKIVWLIWLRWVWKTTILLNRRIEKQNLVLYENEDLYI